MNDTSLKMMAKMEEMLRAKAPSERLRMGCSMFNLSKRIVKGSILRENLSISGLDFREALFLKFYRSDFGPVQQKKNFEYWRRQAGAK